MELLSGLRNGGGVRSGWMAMAAVGLFLLAGCDRPDPPSDPELRAELGIADEVQIHRVMVTGAAEVTRLIPAYLEVTAGDLVQFQIRGHRVHQVVFETDELTAEARAFLERTGQLAPPPLTASEARLVLSFEGAPEGIYPYRMDGYAPSVTGHIMVRHP